MRASNIRSLLTCIYKTASFSEYLIFTKMERIFFSNFDDDDALSVIEYVHSNKFSVRRSVINRNVRVVRPSVLQNYLVISFRFRVK